MKRNGIIKLAAIAVATGAAVFTASCSSEKGISWEKGTSAETIVKEAAAANGVGNWGLGNEYEILALLQN